MDFTGLTLAQIKETVKRIEGKIDIVLETPLKQAKDRFRASLNMISHKNQEKAYETLKDVLDHATQAFYYMDSNDMTMADLEACVQATQLLIFSNIARFSYDKSSETFLPFLTLPMEDKAMIATELMDIVNRCLENRRRVKKNSLFSRSSDHKAKVQDILDTILQVTYPFISEGKGWTKSMTKFDLKENTVDIRVMPKYVPMGEERKITLILGVYTQEKKYQKIYIWRSKDMIFISGYGNYSRKISSETDMLEFSINHFIVLSSTGGAAKHYGGVLGLYCYDPDMDCFAQFSTERDHENHEPCYVYPIDDEWRVNKTPGEKTSWLKNLTKSKNVPANGWMHYDVEGKKTWHADRSLVISPGIMTSLCDKLTVSASGAAAERWPECLGEFSRTEMWWRGRPVFRNSQGELLYNGWNGWIVGFAFCYASFEGSIARQCPATEKKWSYWDESKDHSATVQIECKVHA